MDIDTSTTRQNSADNKEGSGFQAVKTVPDLISAVVPEFGDNIAAVYEDQRQEICTEVATALGLDFDAIRTKRGLSLLTPDELRQLDDYGIDVQLHTHRHTFPSNDPEQARSEVLDNRVILEKVLGRRLEHFCYPSGVWSRNLLPMLNEEGIVSATTCQAGMNDQTTNPLALYRVLDQDNMHDIELEAELTGFCELLRIVSGRRRRTDKAHSDT